MRYSIPFEILLFFDAIDDLYRLPSKEVIFIALNNLFNHPSKVLRKLYFISSLFKLSEDILEEWMNLHFKDEKSLSTIVYQRLWSLQNRNPSIKFFIDQILRRTIFIY